MYSELFVSLVDLTNLIGRLKVSILVHFDFSYIFHFFVNKKIIRKIGEKREKKKLKFEV